MRHFLIDGNNLLGKLSVREKSFRPENPASRELLTIRLRDFFREKNDSVTLFFDGHESEKINGEKIKIVYSDKREADALIREKIERTKNRKTLVIVSSDNQIRNFARVCSSETILSEEFASQISRREAATTEDKIPPSTDKEFFLKLFTSGKPDQED